MLVKKYVDGDCVGFEEVADVEELDSGSNKGTRKPAKVAESDTGKTDTSSKASGSSEKAG